MSWIIEAEHKERRLRWRKVLIYCVFAPLATLAAAFCGLLIVLFGPPRFFPSTQTIASKAPVCGTWNATAWPDVDGGGLNSLAVISKDDIWAVGEYGSYMSYKPLVRHWDGKRWSDISSPTQGKGEDWFEDVAAVSANDVWAVGVSSDRTLIQHWDGTAWSIVPSPNAGTHRNELHGVAAVASDDVWAVGFADLNEGSQSLILHWNGHAWGISPIPVLPSRSYRLKAITAVSANDIWAVGYVDDDALTMHWDGAAWRMIPSIRHNGTVPIGLHAVSANGSDDVWAVGSYWKDIGGGVYTTDLAVMHWNGFSWTEFFIPRPENDTTGSLSSVAAITANDVWVVGDHASGGHRSAFAAHWNGKNWSLVTSPAPLNKNSFADVAAIPEGGVWAVGSSQSYKDGPMYALVAHFDPCAPVAAP